MNLSDQTSPGHFPLPHNWALKERISDSICILGKTFYRNGLFAVSGDKIALGSVGGIRSRADLAYYELLERIYLQEFFPRTPVAPEDRKHYAYALSNGAAIHTHEDQAVQNARLELIERDRILRSWYGEYAPKVYFYRQRHWDFLKPLYSMQMAEFSNPDDALDDISVIGLFCFPRKRENLFFHAFGADLEREKAISKAERELSQRISFLWDEGVDEMLPFSPGPAYHQEFYLSSRHSGIIKDWLDGKHGDYWPRYNSFIGKARSDLEIVQKKIFFGEGNYFLVKARGGNRVPLYFGQKYPVERRHHLIHPII
ncbi:MAG: YcaO-like family protein [Bacteriovoracales bacterium]|nr:YcaO-like family protein [Bacteriovoracales bacterium]